MTSPDILDRLFGPADEAFLMIYDQIPKNIVWPHVPSYCRHAAQAACDAVVFPWIGGFKEKSTLYRVPWGLITSPE